jgi:RHS repeat-associated protein
VAQLPEGVFLSGFDFFGAYGTDRSGREWPFLWDDDAGGGWTLGADGARFTVSLGIILPAPVNFRAVKLGFAVADGYRVAATLLDACGTFPTNDTFFATGLDPCSFVPAAHLFMSQASGVAQVVGTNIDASHCELTLPVATTGYPYYWENHRVHDPAFPSDPSAMIESGEAIVSGVVVNLTLGVPNPRLVPSRGVQVESSLGGQLAARATLAAFPDLPPRVPHLESPLPGSGATANLLWGELGYRLCLFKATGPGLPVEMTLAFHGGNAAYCCALKPTANAKTHAYYPFGHGWNSLYTLRILPLVVNSTSTEYWFQDADGRMSTFGRHDTGTNFADAPGSSSGYESVAFHEDSGNLRLTRNPDGTFHLEGKAGRVMASFETQGRLVELKRTDHGRGVKLHHDPAKVTLTDTQGRVVTWQLDADGNVTRVTDPYGGTWDVQYVDGRLEKIAHTATGYGWSFSYDADSGQMLSLNRPGSLPTTFSYQVAGDGNRLFAETLQHIAEDDYFADLAFATSTFEDCTLNIAFAAGYSMRHQFQSWSSYVIFDTYEDGNCTRRYMFHKVAGLASISYPQANNYATTFAYNSQYQVISITFPDPTGTRVSYGFDPNNPRRMITQTDRLSRVTDITYVDNANARDLVKTVTHPPADPAKPQERAVETHDYNDDGDPLSFDDPMAVLTDYDLSTAAGTLGLVVKKTVTDQQSNDSVEQFVYDALGNITQRTGPEGEITKYDYDALGRLVKATQPSGDWIRYDYDPQTFLLGGIVGSEGQLASYQRDSQGRVVVETTAERGQVTFTYDEFGLLKSAAHADGGRFEYVYNARRRLKEETEYTDAGTITRGYEYDVRGNVTLITVDEPGQPQQQTSFTYTEMNDLKDVTHPSMYAPDGVTVWHPTEHYQYTANDLMKRQDRDILPGQIEVVEYDYDGRDRCIAIRKGNPPTEFSTEAFEYDLAGNVTGHSGDGFTSSNLKTQQRQRVRTHRTHKYDGLGRPSAIQDSAGNTLVQVERDRSGRVTQINLPDSTGALKTVEKRSFQNGLLMAVEDEGGNATAIGYGTNGRPNLLTDPLGNTIAIGHDLGLRPLQYAIGGQDGSTSVQQFVYDGRGLAVERTQIRNGMSETTRFAYTGEGRLASITDPLGHTVAYSYDPGGDLVERTDARSGVTKYEYDSAHKLLRATYPNGNSVHWVHDLDGRVMSVEDSRFSKTFERNVLGDATRITWLDKQSGTSRTIQLDYDAYCMLSQVTDDAGLLTTYEYDDENRIARVSQGMDPAQLQVLAEFTHDIQGRLSKRVTGEFTTTWTRDATGHVLAIDTSKAGTSVSRIEYQYDALGRRVAATYVHIGVDTDWTYDGVGRLVRERILSPGGKLSEDQLAFDAAGNCTARWRGDVLTLSTYNAVNQLLEADDITFQRIPAPSLAASADSELDAAHAASIVLGTAGAQTFASADVAADHWLRVQLNANAPLVAMNIALPMGRPLPSLLRVSVEGAMGSWSAPTTLFASGATWKTATARDAIEVTPSAEEIALVLMPVTASAVQIVQPQGSAPATATFAPRALSISAVVLFTANVDTTTYQYDADGNLVSDGKRGYAYDAEGRLVRVTQQGLVDQELVYGPDGSLAREIDHLTGHSVDHLYLDANRFADYDESGTLLTRYLATDEIDGEFAFVVPAAGGAPGTGDLHYLLRDAIGTVHQVLGPSMLVETRLATGWGEPLAANPALALAGPATYSTPIAFAGRAQLDGLDLLDNRARTYAPALGRFLSPDPSGGFGGLNRYAYVHGDPVDLRDQDGRIFTQILGGLVSVGIGWGLAKVTNTKYELSDAAIDFGVGFVSSGLSAAAKCGKLGQTVYRLTQAGAAGNVLAKGITTAAGVSLGVTSDYIRDYKDGKEFSLGTSICAHAMGAAIGSVISRTWCFPAGSRVQTPNGLRAIEDLRVGDEVLSRDVFTGAETRKPIARTFSRESAELLEVTLKEGEAHSTIRCTPQHPWYVEARGWTSAAHLCVGNRVAGASCALPEIVDIRVVPERVTVYNLEIEGFHTYFVGAHSGGGPAVWVHNQCPVNTLIDFVAERRASFNLFKPAAEQGEHVFATLLTEAGEVFHGMNSVARRMLGLPAGVAFRDSLPMALRKMTGRMLPVLGATLTKGVNAATRDAHAEGAAFAGFVKYAAALARGGMRASSRAVLVVDKALCQGFCQSAGGVTRLARKAMLEELYVVERMQVGPPRVSIWTGQDHLIEVSTLPAWVEEALQRVGLRAG